MSSAAEVTTQTFEQEVLKSDMPVMVDFWAEWCGPCKMLAPAVDAIAEEFAGKLKVLKLDIDKDAAIASKYGVMSIPTLIIFKGGTIAEQIIGNQTKQKIIEKIQQHLS
ncbi:thioredoxin [uncultured Desulfobulbus sp.]|jgi:thioredoxin 1|uniref:thioredoxin n=1 Tax=uncultured Desulfobulbus sp. TaxID=239745 RepID=UPI0029C96B12|nr:thioredoxin [uncultured Desulfobulbus sp.]